MYLNNVVNKISGYDCLSWEFVIMLFLISGSVVFPILKAIFKNFQ